MHIQSDAIQATVDDRGALAALGKQAPMHNLVENVTETERGSWVGTEVAMLKRRNVLNCVKRAADLALENSACRHTIPGHLKYSLGVTKLSYAIEEAMNLQDEVTQSFLPESLTGTMMVWGRQGTTRAERRLDDLDQFFDSGAMFRCGFNMRERFKQWGAKCKEPVEARFLLMLERLEGEVLMCRASGRCSEDSCTKKGGSVCPEGTACGCGDQTAPIQAGVVTGATYAGITTLKVGGGFIVGGPTGAVAGYLLPTPDLAVAAGVGAFASTKNVCHCTKLDCVWNSDLEMCVLARDNAAALNPNPYRHLPLPGTKCVVKDPTDEAEMRCEIDTCIEDDFQVPKLGRLGSDVFNCHPETLAMLVPRDTEAANSSSITASESIAARVRAYRTTYKISLDDLFPVA